MFNFTRDKSKKMLDRKNTTTDALKASKEVAYNVRGLQATKRVLDQQPDTFNGDGGFKYNHYVDQHG